MAKKSSGKKKSKSKSRSRSRTKSASRKSKSPSRGKKSKSKSRRSRSKSRPRKCTKPSDYDDPKAVFFPGVSNIKYEGPKSTNPMAFKYYNANEKILGKKISDWCRFSVVFWHTFRGKGSDPFGGPTITRPWDDESETLANAYRRTRAAFEFMSKLGNKFYAFHDRDVAPEGKDINETNSNLDKVSDLMLKLQKKTGVKLLWATQNLFSATRYMNGAATNPNLHSYAYACA